MSRTKIYQVRDNRIRFICENCKTKRVMAIPPQVRSRTVKCHNCGTISRCALNRRQYRREQQRGKATMMLAGGREMSVDLQDISLRGVGISTAPGGGRMVSVHDEVHIKCGWNPRLFAHGRLIVKSINGDRIGIENIAKVSWS